jgi:hypothetical protein
MIAEPVKVLVIEAMRYKVDSSGRRGVARSANPTPADQMRSPPVTMPTAGRAGETVLLHKRRGKRLETVGVR